MLLISVSYNVPMHFVIKIVFGNNCPINRIIAFCIKVTAFCNNLCRVFKQIFIKAIINYRDMRTICPKIFAKLDFFAIMSWMDIAHSILKIFWAFLTFSHLCLAYLALKSFQKHNFFRKKDNLAVLFVKLKVTNCLEWESM